MRASSVAHTSVCPPAARAASAMTSKVSIGNTGMPAPNASPCATEHAVRKPVKAPGPRPKAIASSCCGEVPA